MSNAIAQSATVLAVSPTGENDFDIVASVKRCAERTAKGTTRERQFLQRNKLISSVCADYRSHFPAIYGKTERLPSEVYERIEGEVDKFITSHLSRINPINVISLRRGFYHNAKEMEITERIVNTGENKLTLQEQLLGVDIFITSAEKRLRDLEKKPTPDYDREKEVKAQIMRLNLTKQFILGEMSHQEKAVKEATK
jgi:hypothetical protein